MRKTTEKAKGSGPKVHVRAKKKAVSSEITTFLGPTEAEILAEARMYLKNTRERKEKGCHYRWAQLVIQRHEAGRSIANAKKDWFGKIMAGMDDPEYFD